MLISCIVVVLLKTNDVLICCNCVVFIFVWFDIFVVILGLFLFFWGGAQEPVDFFLGGKGVFWGEGGRLWVAKEGV